MSYDDDNEFPDDDFSSWMVGSAPTVVPPKLFTTKEEDSYGPKPVKVRPVQTDEDGEEIEDDGYRKPFFNPNGREVVPDDIRSDVITSLKLTKVQHKLFIALGGGTWLKEMLAKANLDTDKCKRLKEKERIEAKRLKNGGKANGHYYPRKNKVVDE